MSEQTFELVAIIRSRLQAAVRRMTRAEVAYGAVFLLGVTCSMWLVAMVLEAGLWLDAPLRTALLGVVVAATAGVAVYLLAGPVLVLLGLRRGPAEDQVAERIGAHFPEVSDRLVNLLQLAAGRRSASPDPMVDMAVRTLGEQVRHVPFEEIERFDRARRASRLACVPVVGIVLLMAASPQAFLGASGRLLSPGQTFERPAPFTMTVAPGDVELVRGESLELVVRTAGTALPSQVVLALQQEGESHVEEVLLTTDSTDVFRHTVANVRRSFRYRATADGVSTGWHEAVVTERPIVRGLQLTLQYPPYTRIPPQRLEPNVGDVNALPGTRVLVEVGHAGRGVEEALLVFDDGAQDTLALDGTTARGSFTLRRDGAYQVRLRNENGLENGNPITYHLSLLADAHPTVALVEPATEAELDESLRARLRARITDDYGFSRAELFYRLAESRFGTPSESFTVLPLPLPEPLQLDQEILFDWMIAQMTDLDPVPGDVIEYYVQVRDNDAVAGFKAARSAVHRFRLPSLAEQYRALDEKQQEAEQTMESLLGNTEEIRQEFEQLRNELRRKQEADWEDRRSLEQLQHRQQQLENRVEEVARQIETMTRQMQENSLVDEKTLDMYRELQRVAEEINSPELQEALRELQKAMEELNLQQMQQAIDKFEFNEEQYRQRLERTLDLFKRLKVQQELDEAARLAEDLARRQEELREQTEALEKGERDERKGQQASSDERQAQSDEEAPPKEERSGQQEGANNQGENRDGTSQEDPSGGPQEKKPNADEAAREDLAREQETASEEMKALEEQLRELAKRMEEMRAAPTEEIKQLEEQARQQRLPQRMQQNAEQLRQNRLQQAQQQQQQMQQQLEQMQQQLGQMREGMEGQQQQVNTAGLRRALSDILTLSQSQESVREELRRLAGDSPAVRDLARRQVELSEGLRVVSDTLQKLSRNIPQMSRVVQQTAGEAQLSMNEASDALGERSQGEAAGHQKASMTHLNDLALLLSELLNQMMNGQSGSGSSMEQLMQQMQQMAGQQQQLNQQLQQMLNDIQGNRLSSDMQKRMAQMAAQQEAIRQQLQEVGRNPEARGKLLGDLEKIGEQMEETIREMQQRQVGDRTVERQREILTRLLDAQRSVRERGEEPRREGSTSKDEYAPGVPPALTPEERAEKLRRDLLRSLESGYAPDYEELIKRYFELLQQQTDAPAPR